MPEKEASYVLTIVEAAAQSQQDKVLAEALEVCGLVLRGWLLPAAKHRVYVEKPKQAKARAAE